MSRKSRKQLKETSKKGGYRSSSMRTELARRMSRREGDTS
jgi:hypothetical protein